MDYRYSAQTQMCEFFGRERSVITKHINNVFKEGELKRHSVCAKDGKTYRKIARQQRLTLIKTLEDTMLEWLA